MGLQYCTLGSGSRGNALLVESGDTLLLIDCGLPRRAIEERMQSIGRDPSDITALLVTHEHGDHCQGVGPLRRRYGMPVWMTMGTAGAIDASADVELLNCHRPLSVGSISIEPYPVPHDAREPCQFVFSAAGRRLGLLTDTGHVTTHIKEQLRGCHALALEFNHDVESLRCGPYPASVKSRVGSDFGHLNNGQASRLLEAVSHQDLQHVTGLHMSEQNNSRELVLKSIESVSDDAQFSFTLSRQESASDWFRID